MHSFNIGPRTVYLYIIEPVLEKNDMQRKLTADDTE